MMIWTLVKKQMLLLFRSPQELLMLLLMPLVLIAILGFALGSFMSGDTITLNAKVAIVEHSNEQEDLDLFFKELEAKNIPEELSTQIYEGVKKISPITMLKNDIFGSEELMDSIEIETFPPSELSELKTNDDYDIVIEFPEQFTSNLLSQIFLDKEYDTVIQLYKNEGKLFAPNMIEDILTAFQTQYTQMTILGMYGLTDNQEISQFMENLDGSIESITSREPISSLQYYTVGMAVMFVLFISSTIAAHASREKELHVFDRIILSNTSGFTYFTSVFLSGWVLAFLQLLIICGVSTIIYGIYWEDFFGFILLCCVLAFAVGGITTCVTAINFKLNSDSVSTAFGNIGVAILAFFGGSYMSIGNLSPVIQTIGDFTPNGAAMSSFLMLLQGYSLADIANNVIYLTCLGIVFLILAILSFPKRGDV